MALATADAPLLELTDARRARPLPRAIRDARSELAPLVADILAIPESVLNRDWSWIGGGEAEIRYGIYRAHELFEQAEIDASRALDESGAGIERTAAIVAPATAARWDLHGLLAPLAAGDIDADPGGGEWSVRRTMGHVVNGQRAYGWATAWWLAKAFALEDPDLPPRVDGALYESLPDEDGPEMAGSLDEIRARFDATLDLSTERLAGLPAERLELGSRWTGFAVTVAFRLGRWSSHIREHAIQVEKTLAAVGRAPTEPERLVRLVLAAYGRAEAVVFGRQSADAAAEIIRAAAAEARQTVADARRAAEVDSTG
jgi:hypothetical protein